jgi:isopenicillin-N N-acyltransferase like protein
MSWTRDCEPNDIDWLEKGWYFMTTTQYPVIQVSGDAYERGRQHGERARDRVEESVAIYRTAFEHNNKLAWSSVLERASGFADAIGDWDPSILTEMQGIADGSGFKLEEIVAVNCRTEILFGARHRAQVDASAHECTTIAVGPNASAGGKTLIGKNWDWRSRCQDSVIILQVEQSDGPDFVIVVEAGMVGRDGFNEDGIAVYGNLLRSTKDGGNAAIPVPILRRRIINSRRVDDAFSAVLRAQRAASTNYLIAHESGIIIDFEATPEHVYSVYPTGGLLTHSNHFTSLAAQVHGVDANYSADSLYRHQRAWDLLEPKVGEITIDDVQNTLRDHAGYPKSICRHDDERDHEANRSASIASIVIDLTDRVMFVASGPPCSHEYQKIGLPKSNQVGEKHAKHARVAAD